MHQQEIDWDAPKTPAGQRIDVACAIAVGICAMFWLELVARRWHLEMWLPFGIGIVAVALYRHLQPRQISPAEDP